MGNLATIIAARVFLALAGALVFMAYRLLEALGSPAGLLALGMFMVAFVFLICAIGCSIASYDEWDLVRFRAMKKRGDVHMFC